MPKKQHRHEGPPPIFGGNIAAAKRLASARMMVLGKLRIYRGRFGTWEATTDRGPRWVWHDNEGWHISKTPPESPAGSTGP